MFYNHYDMLQKANVKINRRDDYTEYTVEPLGHEESVDRSSDQVRDFNEIKKFINGEVDEAEGIVNWVGSGSCVVLNTKDGLYVPVGYRDEGAPTHPDKLCTASGIADNISEISNPRLLSVKELEEILIYDKQSDCWRKPVIENDELVDGRRSPNLTHCLDVMSLNIKGNSTRAYRKAESEFHLIGNDRVYVRNMPFVQYNNNFTGHIVLDEDTGNVDLVDLVTIDITDRSIEDVRIVDGEVAGDTHLDRPVYLFETDEFYDLLNGETEALRKYKSAKVYSGNGYTDGFSEGVKVKREFDAVPTLKKSHDRIVEEIRNLSL